MNSGDNPPPPDPKFVQSQPAGGEPPDQSAKSRHDLTFIDSPECGGPPFFDPDLSLIAEQETDLRPRGCAADLVAELAKEADLLRRPYRYTARGEYVEISSRRGVIHFEPDYTLNLGLVRVEPWRWWMRFVPGRPRAVNYLRSFPPGPTQDEDAQAWWESLR